MTERLKASERQLLNRYLAKAIAYHDCGDSEKAQQWAEQLIQDLTNLGIYDADRLLE